MSALRLWKDARPHIESCGSEDSPELPIVEANIREFENMDPKADGFRYPVSKNQACTSLPDAPKWVNLETLHDGMLTLSNFFDAVRAELSVRRDYLEQSLAELNHPP